MKILSRLASVSKITDNPDEIREIFDDIYDFTEGKDYKINPDCSVDIFRNFDIEPEAIEGGKLKFKIHKIDGDLYYSSSKNGPITSLEGFPEEVTGDVKLYFLNTSKGLPKKIGGNLILTGLEDSVLKDLPEKINGDLDLTHSAIQSLEGCSKKIKGDFKCTHCKNLKSLKGGPKEVSGDYDCGWSGLTSLEGAPEKVGGDFDCAYSKITSLEGAPKEVGGDFDCASCLRLTSLKGAPEKVGGDFRADFCKDLTSLEGVPEKVGGKISLPEIRNKIEKVATHKKEGPFTLIQDSTGYYAESPGNQFQDSKSPEKAMETLKWYICLILEYGEEEAEELDEDDYEDEDEYEKAKKQFKYDCVDVIKDNWSFGKGKYGKMLEDMVNKRIKEYLQKII